MSNVPPPHPPTHPPQPQVFCFIATGGGGATGGVQAVESPSPAPTPTPSPQSQPQQQGQGQSTVR